MNIPLWMACKKMSNLLLNLKGIVLSCNHVTKSTINLRKEGPGVVTAKDIDLPHDVEIINPDHVIAHLSAGGKLDMQSRLKKVVAMFQVTFVSTTTKLLRLLAESF
jgi:DNA-directed RNA polymerase alpha subunit